MDNWEKALKKAAEMIVQAAEEVRSAETAAAVRSARTLDLIFAHVPGVQEILDRLVTNENDRKFLEGEGYLRKARKPKE